MEQRGTAVVRRGPRGRRRTPRGRSAAGLRRPARPTPGRAHAGRLRGVRRGAERRR
ncbi:hypothetical protein QHG49_06890 [Streptomyces sp. WP-1]|nr:MULTISPECIES: hypothetical protein [Streptomyces]WKE73723.1 hypothetical protein QHG49_06890 [Streptomyces sp. WP-1]